METPAKIRKLDEVVVNRIAAGEIIQRPANALKELIENSLDAKSTNIQITAKEGGLKLLQIQDNGTGIRKDDMDIICERFTTSKLQKFDDLKSIATFGFRGEALASISHVALLTITTKTAMEKCGYKASYIDSKLKGAPKPCAGNQGTTILIENLFYNVATRRKALASPSEEFAKIADVVTRYSVHNANVGFTLKKHGEVIPQVRTPHNSTKINNIKILYGNPVARELLEIETNDDTYKFKMQALVTNPNYTSKRMTFLLFINNRLVDSTPIRKMIEELYSIYLPKKSYPWCYVSLEINPSNVDVNVHPTKHEVRFLHEDAIIERMKIVLDEKLSCNNASRTFYLQARMPWVDITREKLGEILPEYDRDNPDVTKKNHPREMIRMSSSDQKLDKFNFTILSHNENNSSDESLRTAENDNANNREESPIERSAIAISTLKNLSTIEDIVDFDDTPKDPNFAKIRDSPERANFVQIENQYTVTEANLGNDIEKSGTKGILLPVDTPPNPETPKNFDKSNWSKLVDETSSAESCEIIAKNSSRSVIDSLRTDETAEKIISSSIFEPPSTEDDSSSDATNNEIVPISKAADRALKTVYKYYGTQENNETTKKSSDNCPTIAPNLEKNFDEGMSSAASDIETNSSREEAKTRESTEFKSYSVNKFRIQVKLRSILELRKKIEDNRHEGLREILSNMIFVGSVDEKLALVQSGVNLYICDTIKLAEELFYQILLYDFQNYGVFKFSQPLPLEELALLALDTEEAGWTEEDGTKEDVAARVKELLLEKADLLNEYFSINIDRGGNLKSLPVLLDKYIPCEAELPLYVLCLATEVDWTMEKSCLDGICRETAKFYSHVNTRNETQDWKNVIEHILYCAIKDSLFPPKYFAHDSTILRIASLPDLYKVFERC